MPKHAKSFFERLTGSANAEDDFEEEKPVATKKAKKEEDWDEEEEGQLTIDMFQTPEEIVIQTMVAGVKPDELDVSISKDMITIKGKRQTKHEVAHDNYYYKELYWGTFSRSILLPQEVDSDRADASIKNGLLVIKLPKIDKEKIQRLDIKSND